MNRQKGFGLYLCRFADLGVEESKMIAPSLRDLLVNNIGIEVLTDQE
ncbi:hypothetical protein [Paenibacillus sedimenti]|nr:hypothetical protein [Paenibacillus sedimenti]